MNGKQLAMGIYEEWASRYGDSKEVPDRILYLLGRLLSKVGEEEMARRVEEWVSRWDKYSGASILSEFIKKEHALEFPEAGPKVKLFDRGGGVSRFLANHSTAGTAKDVLSLFVSPDKHKCLVVRPSGTESEILSKTSRVVEWADSKEKCTTNIGSATPKVLYAEHMESGEVVICKVWTGRRWLPVVNKTGQK